MDSANARRHHNAASLESTTMSHVADADAGELESSEAHCANAYYRIVIRQLVCWSLTPGTQRTGRLYNELHFLRALAVA